MSNHFLVRIVSSDGKIFNDNIEELYVETNGGIIGILKDHQDMVATIKISHIKVVKDKEIIYFSTSGGILNVDDKVVTVILDTFERLEEIDEERANKDIEKAQNIINDENSSENDKEIAKIQYSKAINRLKLINRG